MKSELRVILTQTAARQPLATVRNLPGEDADMTPAQMRALAAALLIAADDCERQPMDSRHFMRRERGYCHLGALA